MVASMRSIGIYSFLKSFMFSFPERQNSLSFLTGLYESNKVEMSTCTTLTCSFSVWPAEIQYLYVGVCIVHFFQYICTAVHSSSIFFHSSSLLFFLSSLLFFVSFPLLLFFVLFLPFILPLFFFFSTFL
jgi:hypothetical protein